MSKEENKLFYLSLLFVPIFLFGLFVGLVGGYSYFYLYKSPINNTILDNQLLAQEEIIDLLYSQKAQLKNLEHNYIINVQRSEQCNPLDYNNMQLRLMPHYTGSMRPYMFGGDYLLITEYDSNKRLVLGDVVSTDVLHRIVSISYQDETFKTKGDNNKYMDSKTYNFTDVSFVVCGVLRGPIN